MDREELAQEIVRRGGVLPDGILVFGKKTARRLGIEELLERFHGLCDLNGLNPRQVIYPHWKQGARTTCVRCHGTSRFRSLKSGYDELCPACKETDRVRRILETKRRMTSETGEYPGAKRAVETRRAKYGASLMSVEARVGAAERMSDIRSRLKEFMGVENPSMLPSVQEKKRQNAMARYGVLHQQKHLGPDAVAMLSDPTYLASKSSIDIERETGVSQSHLSKILARHGLSPERSSFERSFHEWLDGLGIGYRKNLRKMFGMREMDIVIDGPRRLCVELNGLYWHSRSDDRLYHLDKTEAARDAGYPLFHVWEDDWRDRREIVQSMVASRLGRSHRTMARTLTKQAVGTTDANRFFEQNHLQGPSSRITEAYALLDHDGNTMMCMGIGRSRFSAGEELIRLATKCGMTIVGGFTRLLSMVEGRRLRSYCRLDVSTGDGYLASGWKLVGRTRPGYWYTDRRSRFNRLRFQKHLITARDDPRPEWKVMLEDRNLHRIWDCGQLVFELNT